MASILGLITIAFLLIILFQIAKANEMASVLKSGGSAVESNENNKIHGLLFLVFGVLFMVGCLWSCLHYAPLFLPPASSVHGKWIEDMFFWTLVATVPVFVLTHIALFWFSYKYSDDGTRKAYYFPGSNQIEMIWTVIPAIVMVFLVVEGMRNWYKITGPAPEDAIIVEVTGKQFTWDIRYAGADNKLGGKSVKYIGQDNGFGQDWTDKANHDDFTANELHLPVGKPVLVKINALDVLHSFYLPHFKVKMDAVPGIPTQFWFIPTKTTAQMREELNKPEFEYELACAELCGPSHSNMRRAVIVEEQAAFDKWFKEQQPLYQGQVMPPRAPRKVPSSGHGHAAPAHGHEGDHSREGTKEGESKEQEQPAQPQEGTSGGGH